MDELMIKIDNVGKKYKLGQIGGTTLREEMQRLSAKLRKKEDPTAKIGAATVNIGEEFWALKGISFEVKKGERVGIIGHNGAGKSTLLKLLSRITTPTEGMIGLNGRVASMLEVGTGFHPELTGRENIYMNGAILGMTKKEIDAKMEEIIEFSECRQFIDTPVKRYSSGMYVKLAFSVAAHLDSEIMIMDEVLAVGDVKFQEKCLKKMSDVSKQDGRTILFVSHNMNIIRKLCDRCIVLERGNVIFDGKTENAIKKYMNDDDKTKTHIDFDNRPRTGYQIDEFVKLRKVDLIDTNESRYSQNELIRMKTIWLAKGKKDNIAIRLTVMSSVGDIVGMTSTHNEITVQEGENVIEVCFNHRTLAPGEYTMKIVAYSVNEFGQNQLHDVVDEAVMFEILQDDTSNNSMGWNNNWWGYMMFDPLEIVE